MLNGAHETFAMKGVKKDVVRNPDSGSYTLIYYSPTYGINYQKDQRI